MCNRAARHAAKTHCPQGHPYSGENLYYGVYGNRLCRTCSRVRSKKHYWSVTQPQKEGTRNFQV